MKITIDVSPEEVLEFAQNNMQLTQMFMDYAVKNADNPAVINLTKTFAQAYAITYFEMTQKMSLEAIKKHPFYSLMETFIP
ncbi:MAG: hypothetical protein CMH26_02900 [Micavibrio sp.]|nr:hypothetical protein [Micavibrio sp.]